jgi:hypothetical protein
MELLGALPDTVKFVIVFLLILGILAPLLWRRFSVGTGHTGARGRQARLSVIETAAVDVRHRLVLVKRDNVEHLLLVGGPTTIVVEPNIARTPAAREPRPIPDARAEVARQEPPPVDAPDWGLPVEPMAARPAPTVDLDAALPEPPARTAREAMVDSMRAVRSGAAARRGPPPDFDPPPEEVAAPALTPSPGEGYRQPPPEQRRPAAAAPAAEPQRPEPAAEVPPQPRPEPRQSETRRDRPAPPRPVQPIPAAPPPRPVQPAAGAPRQVQPVPAASPSRPVPPDEGNFAEMAQRLEAALRRPTKAEPPPVPAARPSSRPEPPAGRKPAHADAAGPAKPGIKSPDLPPDLKVVPGKGKNEAALDSLEDDLARMLGRPGKS